MSYIATGTAAQDALIRRGTVGPYAPYSINTFRPNNTYAIPNIPYSIDNARVNSSGINLMPPSTFGYKSIVNQEELTTLEIARTNELLLEAVSYSPQNQVIRSAQQLNTRGIGVGFLSPLANVIERPNLLPLNTANYAYMDLAQQSRYALNGTVPLDLVQLPIGSRIVS